MAAIDPWQTFIGRNRRRRFRREPFGRFNGGNRFVGSALRICFSACWGR